MKLSRDLNLKLTQKLTLSKELLLSLKLIQMPLLDLRERIETEILENPALEIKEKNKTPDQDLEVIENSFSDDVSFFEDSSSADINVGLSPNSSRIDEKRQFLEGVISREESLSDHLVSQLECQNLSEKHKEIGRILISLVNPDGFLTDNLNDVFHDKNDLALAEEVLEIIQMFDPPGIASRGIQEALLFQLESMKKEEINENAYVIIRDYFDFMAERKDNEILKQLKISREELKDAFEFMGRLNPFPGREFAPNDVKYIIPDAYVYQRDHALYVEMNEDILPALTINRYLEKIATDFKRKKKASDEQKYVVDKVNNANQFIKLINYRGQSLFKLVLAIVDAQEEFFYKGPKFLKPLIMKEIAEKIGLSESTISRLASSKYIQTEWGIHEIKYFFSNSISNDKGVEKSSESIREMIKEIYENERESKLSDQKIVDILSNKGIKIARRTVAKYRKMLDILPSHKRNL